ncbi:sulfur carrier protein ThiS [Cellulomonas sp. PhB143]|uniref:sulfur carrier protein ThiS n=1 Tax=Cellulomonas sp. PhB143 TaxID=2485186 RepID=UPI000F4A0B86|nr:sulfur carrier protein ThiS [Cellulomonas sp. PhB143]ROS78995.1 sulfur carrier protein [Cellulomonas sp. PhB143]
MSTRTTRPAATVNGAPFPLDGATDVASVVASLVPPAAPDDRPRGVAVAVNDAVVPHGEWRTTLLVDGDRLEIVTAVQGG